MGFMRLTAILFIVLSLASCNAQQVSNKLKFKEVGWTLYIPTGSQLLSTAEFDSIKTKAVTRINNTYGTSETLNEIRPLFTITDKRYNTFNSTINLYDSTMFKSWEESYEASKEMLIDLLNKQGGEVIVSDTSSAVEKIDGLQFQRFDFKTIYPKQNLTMHTYWFYRKQGIYDFSINISFTDVQIGKQYLEIVRNSKFEK